MPILRPLINNFSLKEHKCEVTSENAGNMIFGIENIQIQKVSTLESWLVVTIA